MNDTIDMTDGPDDRLRRVGEVSLDSDGDRGRHAAATAVSGIVFALWWVLDRELDGRGGWQFVGFALLGVGVLAPQLWVDRAASTRPRHTNTASMLAVIAAGLVALLVVFPLLNLDEQDASVGVGWKALGVATIALPFLGAAAWIARRPT